MIYDENKDLMRVVHRQEEARQLISKRTGWTFRCIRVPKPVIDLSQFKEALF
jgi:hypothetical protein